LTKEAIIIAPELITGLCGKPLGFKVNALKETPLGSDPTCSCTFSTPCSSKAIQ